jgi:DNA-directed RNA polymerase specialized sigma24 family protein
LLLNGYSTAEIARALRRSDGWVSERVRELREAIEEQIASRDDEAR